MLIINSMGGMTFHNLPAGMIQIVAGDDVEERMRAGNCILLLEGGADIHPKLYGEENKYSYPYSRRDDHEIRLYYMAREYNIPVLGICRGHQLMAALEGGTLYQDIEKQVGKDHDYSHSIIFTKYARMVGFTRLMESNPCGSPHVVNSLHHQAVKRVPPNARVLAYAGDLTPEALQYEHGMSVQWHPELLGHKEMLEYIRDTFLVGRV